MTSVCKFILIYTQLIVTNLDFQSKRAIQEQLVFIWNTYILNNPDNHGGVITHLEPDILECEAK